MSVCRVNDLMDHREGEVSEEGVINSQSDPCTGRCYISCKGLMGSHRYTTSDRSLYIRFTVHRRRPLEANGN